MIHDLIYSDIRVAPEISDYTMKYRILILLFFLPSVMLAQTVVISGNVKDTSDNTALHNAVVSFLNEADSTLVSFIRTDKNGTFSKAVPPGDYIILVTSPNYADFVMHIATNEQDKIDLEQIPVISRARLLEEIIITQQAIRIKGDTTEYLADSFRVKENATVEDLLKELPGIQVDRDGKITAQGQTVQRVLVDGDEFFSDDPTIATKNLRADAIKKVQVFDKKSDQAEFTGIDDGQKTKTINLELKENAKNGYFGKLAAAGLDRYYNLQAMINAFKAKRKLAAFAIGSSTSETGLDWQNAGNYGFSSANVQFSGATGGVIVFSGSSSELGSGSFSGTGLPESIKGGVHFSNKWNEDKISLGSNYLFNDLKVRSRTQTLSQNIIENSSYYTEIGNTGSSDRQRNDLSAVLEVKLDSTSSIKVDAKGAIGKNDYINDYSTENITEAGQSINKSIRSTQSAQNRESESVNALYRKRFRKAGQTLSINLNQSYNQSRENGKLYNESQFFDPLTQTLRSRDTTDQKKTSNQLGNSIRTKATYTQPLSSTSFLVFEYTFDNNSSTSEQLTYDPGLPGKYDFLVDSLSNKFRYTYNIHSGGLNYRFTKNKINLSFGGSVSNTAFRQHDFFKDTTHNRSYINLYPRAEISYSMSSFSSVRFDYNGYTTQPTIHQIQPLIDNTDPLNILIGNPDLKQSFTHNFNFFFNDIKVLTERYLIAGVRASVTNNDINESYYLDQLGRRIAQYANTDGNYMANIFGLINMKIPKTGLRLGFGPLVSLYRYTNFVNHQRSITHTANYRARITFQARIPQKLEANFAAMPGYNVSRSNISKASDRNYWASTFETDVNYQLPWKMEIGTDVSADFRQKITSFDRNNNIISWNAYIEKRMLKDESLALRVSMFDILDQNKGFSRFQYATGIQEQRYLTWGQYGLISLTYNFVKRGSKGPDTMRGGFSF